MILRDELFEIGIVNKAHGIDGEISVTFNFDDKNFEDIETIIFEIDGIYVPFFINNIRFKNNLSALISLDEIINESDAQQLINRKIYCLKSDISEDNEILYDYDSLIGYSIVNEDNSVIGKIISIDDSTENSLFIINSDNKEKFIPITEDFILEIDNENHIIKMRLPEGIVDL